MDNTKVLLTPKDVANYLGLSKTSVYALMSRKDFPTIRIGCRKYVTKEDLNTWLHAQVGTQIEIRKG